jgi:hypothetical protein
MKNVFLLKNILPNIFYFSANHAGPVWQGATANGFPCGPADPAAKTQQPMFKIRIPINTLSAGPKAPQGKAYRLSQYQSHEVGIQLHHLAVGA